MILSQCFLNLWVVTYLGVRYQYPAYQTFILQFKTVAKIIVIEVAMK